MIEMNGSQKAVLQKYLVNGETTWEDVCERVCKFVASAEKTEELKQYWYERFLSIMLPMKFVPAGSVLANANHGTNGLMNCFVLSSEDTIQEITKLVSDSILTTKFRGGVGVNIGSEGQPGYIRPKNAEYKDGKALGPCAVLDMVSDCSKKLTTGNKGRRGAFLYSMDWRHPDIYEFISAKTQSVIDADILKKSVNGELSQEEFDTAWTETHLSPIGKRDRRWHNANISVQLDAEFFQLLGEVEEYWQNFLVGKRDALSSKHLLVHELWNKIAEFAYKTADPGLLFMDNMKDKSPIGEFIRCTNPLSLAA